MSLTPQQKSQNNETSEHAAGNGVPFRDLKVDYKGATDYVPYTVYTLRRKVMCKEIPHYKINRKVLFRIGDLLDYVEAHRVEAR